MARGLVQGELQQAREMFAALVQWGSERPELFFVLAAGALLLLFALMVLPALSFAAIIFAAMKLTDASRKIDPPGFKELFIQAKRFFWRVLGVQILITTGFSIMTLILASPVFFLFQIGAHARALLLLLLALVIFMPASLVFGFVHLYGPIFVVLYDKRIGEAIVLSFNLVRQKFLESLILAAFLAGLSFLFILTLVFSIIIMLLPIAFLIWLAIRMQLTSLAQALSALGLLFTGIFAIVFNAGFAVFQSISWVLAVQEMVRTLKLPKEEKTFVPEAASAE